MNATQEQLAALTVPATLPGVVRRGTPVRPTRDHAWHDARGYPCSAKADSVVRGAPCSGYTSVYLCDWGNTPIANCLVDLTDATGRAHVAWAIAASVKHWPTAPDYTTATWRAFRLHKAGVGLMECVGLSHTHHWVWTHHTIAHLDPSDDTRLPDGSRWVDAEALRLVALHVLGTREVPSGTGEVPAGPERSQGGV